MRHRDTILAFVRDNPETNIRYNRDVNIVSKDLHSFPRSTGRACPFIDIGAVKRTTFHGLLLWKRNCKCRFDLDLQSGRHPVALPALPEGLP